MTDDDDYWYSDSKLDFGFDKVQCWTATRTFHGSEEELFVRFPGITKLVPNDLLPVAIPSLIPRSLVWLEVSQATTVANGSDFQEPLCTIPDHEGCKWCGSHPMRRVNVYRRGSFECAAEYWGGSIIAIPPGSGRSRSSVTSEDDRRGGQQILFTSIIFTRHWKKITYFSYCYAWCT